jgi:hypothetical protein
VELFSSETHHTLGPPWLEASISDLHSERAAFGPCSRRLR